MTQREALRYLRIVSGKTNLEFADSIGISTSYLSELETGRKKYTIPLLAMYANVFGVKLSTILAYTERMQQRSLGDIQRKIIEFVLHIDNE